MSYTLYAWGRGTIKIIDTCKDAGLPDPELIERDGGFLVTLFKFSEEQLQQFGLNNRQIKAVSYVKEKGEITTLAYTELFNISDRTARNNLSELSDKNDKNIVNITVLDDK